MEAKDGRPEGRSQKEQKPAKGGLQTRLKNSWVGKHWGTILVLVAVIFIALFVRSYFGYSTAVDNGFLVSGGSDSYYHQRVIDYVQSTGTHLVNDPLMNYPLGIRNERPPLYDWSVAVVSMLISGISGISLTTSTGYTLLFSTAFWGALTCIPVFLITRAAFGNKAGLLAALLLALMPANIQRSVFADADHDAMILFFVVFAFYFLMRALMSINGTKWVTSWKDPRSLRSGLKSYLSSNRKSLIYALLGGTCIATIGMVWTGYTYVLIIVLVYFLVQTVINRFRNVDSMGEFMVVGVMLLSAFALMAPLYWQLNYWNQWFDVPFYLFLGAMVVGGIFMVTRDYPWTLVIPAVVALLIVGLVGIFFFAPNLFEAIVSGQGYLVKSKLYSTIQEAQAPVFSDLVMSIGAITFWFAIVGVVWAAIKIPKNPSPYLVFIVVWMGVSMYMAASAARFMFNSTPAFAMAAGWILAILIGLVKFQDVPKNFAGFWGNKWNTLKKAVKLRHVAAVLFLAFMIVLPNVWGALDAGIPAETERQYDKQIYYALPDILHPDTYDTTNGTSWYLGAFPYSLPLPTTYYPAAWKWFSAQDNNLSIADRPAYLSWWDYGFEAVQSGAHPTVADNFQNGYQMAGSALMAQNESDAIALFIVRILEKTGFNDTTTSILESNGVNVAALQDIMANPSNYIQTVVNNPDVYGPFDPSLDAANAKYAAARVELEKIGEEGLVNLYHDMRVSSGYDIGYFAVDSRLFPFSATSNNIFYAPAKLNDRVIDPTTNAPSDYYTIKAVLSDYSTVDVQNVTSSDQVIGYQIYYTDLFYETMLYRAFMGISPTDVGATSQGIPGISGSMTGYNAMPAYNLTHFKQVYRTAYYNPYNSSEVANHSADWRAVSYDEALYLQQQINAGNISGTVDTSSASLQSGVVFIQYYDGAVLNGTATSNDGTPYAGIHVTVVDEYGIPHQTVQTDANGHYSVLLPFGNVSVVYSAGTLNKQTQIATELDRVNYTVSYAQAQRLEPFTANGDVVLPGSEVSGSVFWDNNGDGRYSAGDQYIPGATVVLQNNATSFSAQTTTDTSGAFRIVGLAGDNNELSAVVDGHNVGYQSVPMTPYGAVNRNIAIEPAQINGTLSFLSGGAAPGVSLSLTDKTTNKVTNTTSGAGGAFAFDQLLPGDYTLTTTDQNLSVGTQSYTLSAGSIVRPSLKMYSATQVSGTVTLNGQPQANVAVGFLADQREQFTITDSAGHYSLTLPQGTYTAYAVTTSGDVNNVAMAPFTASSETANLDLAMVPGSVVTGTVTNGGNPVSSATVIYTNTNDGSFLKGTTNSTGGYRLVLPSAPYFVYAAGGSKAFWGTNQVTATSTQDIALQDSVAVAGKVWYDANGNGILDGSEGLANAQLAVSSLGSPNQVVRFVTDSTGGYNITLPKGNNYALAATLSGYNSWSGTYEPLNAYTTTNIPLTATNQTATGTVTSSGSPISGVTVQFQPADAVGLAASATTDASGAFSVPLKPGSYKVVVDQNVSGDDSSKYQYTGSLTVPVGRAADALAISATVRDKVFGNLTLNGAVGTVRFIGPDNKTVSTTGTFPLYLAPGTYTVYVDATSGGTHYVNLSSQVIAPGTDLSITAQEAQALTGQLQYQGADFKVPGNVTVASGGASLPLTANNQGTFTAYLVNGTYTVGASYHTTAAVNGAQRYVVYSTGSTGQSVPVNGATSADIALSQSLDNVTLSGTIGGAASGVSWQFTALDQTAMDANTTSGASSYSVTLAPGSYSVYGTDGSNNVFLGVVTVRPNQANVANLTLQSGIAVDGTVTYLGAPVAGATVTFSDAAQKTVTTDGTGHYSVNLPSGIYNVTAQSIGQEKGANVTYARSFDLNVTAPTTRNIDLQRQLKGAVEVVWDPSTKQTVNAGDSVTYTVTVYNRGNVDDTYALSSNSAWGVTFSPSTVTLPWGNNASQTVQVTIKTPVDAKVTHPAIKVTAASVNGTGASGSANLDVGINPTYGVSVAPGTPQTLDGNNYTYPFQVKNTGNADDTFNLTLANFDALAIAGWDAKIVGTSNQYQTVSVPAGSTQTVNVVLTKNREAPDPNATVNVDVASSHSTASTQQQLQKGDFSLPDQGLSASGNGVSMSAPQIPASTYVLLGLIVLMAVALVILRVNKGVFGRRRKR